MRGKLHILVLLMLLNVSGAYATHNRAGEITYRHIGGYTYEFTITTYTYRLSMANRSELPVTWGDGSESIVPLVDPPGHQVIENSDYFKNIYIAQHTYPGPGVYQILMQDPNRNYGVDNIPNSENVIFSIKTSMLIGSEVGANNTPVLLNPPIDKATRGHVFIHNPAAYDPDGDSLSFEITICSGANGEPIEGYVLPPVTDTLFIDEIRGDLTWVTPAETGVYNIAIRVDEWREGIRIGRIARDMQIDVYETENNPPVNPDLNDICLVAGDSIYLVTNATDADGDLMLQDIVGGPFEVDNPSLFVIDSSGYGHAYSHFSWVTDCSHARKQPYQVVLKTEDVNDDINLVDIETFSIQVLHQAPNQPVAIPGTDTIRVEWEVSSCGTPVGYNIYRKQGSGPYTPGYCETGVPETTGYQLLDYVAGGSTSHYTDDNKGSGLVPGNEYCYRITAVYNDGAESLSSGESCTSLVPGNPPILKVSVAVNDEVNGAIDLAWAVPRGTDTIDNGPYRYEILRMAPGEAVLTSIAIIPSADLTDTSYTDAGINTLEYPYFYSVVLYYQDDFGEWQLIPGNELASSQYIHIAASDNSLALTMSKRAPWNNTAYEVFREGPSGSFDQIATVIEPEYTDTGLVNERTYTYYTIGQGVRPLFGSDYLTENRSHLASGIPMDTIPPCPPELYVSSECDLDTIPYNYLSWEYSVDTCYDQDVIAFVVYSRDSLFGDFRVLDTLGPDTYTYQDLPGNSIEQCYAVTAIDSAGNESERLPYCVYSVCSFFQLPNVFTPNGDGVNDSYVSWNLNGYVKEVNMTIYNRYGKEVYLTRDPYINWNGMINNKLATSGVYYYICDVYEPRITGRVIKTLKGFIHVYAGEQNSFEE
ncbi:MAG: gliding motility-associated C-terminal domain-containing protein [Bacteroidales bacterium]|nr:gliding motility-associated C-terminal domain-containing protein [Bacteroidales bacterium]